MKKILAVFLIVTFSLIFITSMNNNPKKIISNLAKKITIENGQLHYRIYFFGVLPIGNAVLNREEVEEYAGKKVYHLNATAESLRALSKFFSGSAVLDSYVDTKELSPVLFKQRIIISGKQDVNKETSYDQKEGTMAILGVKRQIFPNTQDPLSAVFNIKRMDFEKIKDIEMNINTNQKNYILNGSVEQKNLTIGKDPYKIVLANAQIKRKDGNPYHKSNITIVLLKEKGNIPILIKVFAGGVVINARLVDIR